MKLFSKWQETGSIFDERNDAESVLLQRRGVILVKMERKPSELSHCLG
jgi:hypothetical protein